MKHANLAYLKSLAPHDNTFAVKVLELFLQEIPDTLAVLKTAVAMHDWNMLHREAHRIKPSVQLIGAPEHVMDTLQHIIAVARSGEHTEKLAGWVADFEAHMQATFPELEAALAEIKD